MTDPRILERPVDIAQAWRQLSEWLERPTAWIPQPTERHAQVLGRLLVQSGARGRLIPDAHLAALAIEHGLELCTNDGDFARFQGLRWSNPLQGA
jgi:toxin-antitoxin system PIN domain toxin